MAYPDEWDDAQWVDFLTEEIVPHTPEEMTVYWQPLTSLKEQYEKMIDTKHRGAICSH